MSRDWIVYLEDILEATTEILNDIDGVSFEQFQSNHLLNKTVLYNFIILGEASKGITEDIREKYPQIDWRGMAGLRDILTHEYFRVNLDTVWDIIMKKLPPIKEIIPQILAEN